VAGSADLALRYAANDIFTSHIELGSKLEHDIPLEDGTLSLEGTIGWAHQLNGASSAQVAFENLPGAGFVLLGTKPATDTALLGVDLQMHDAAGLVYGIRVQDQAGPGTNSATGTLNLAYHW